ncbi:unnamed protein product [Rhizophagus irregularis]|uniref:Uncharacterized protein n=1 Tax=Rhizophagus irregularis TaxID=588596 RepID=A0A916A1X9_9GLOM|nr:unnamed protein product [Rhizophagus irregularis]
MYKEKKVYFISNLTNLNSELCQFQENDISSLSDCFIKFINNDEYMQKKHMLNYYDLVNLEGLGWIEHQILICIKYDSQLSIEINSIDMEIDYLI